MFLSKLFIFKYENGTCVIIQHVTEKLPPLEISLKVDKDTFNHLYLEMNILSVITVPTVLSSHTQFTILFLNIPRWVQKH